MPGAGVTTPASGLPRGTSDQLEPSCCPPERLFVTPSGVRPCAFSLPGPSPGSDQAPITPPSSPLAPCLSALGLLFGC